MSAQAGLSMAMIERMRAYAMRASARPEDADDLVQDVLLAAIAQGRPCHGDRFLPWAFGAIRLHARFVARGAGRRRRREADYASCPHPAADDRRRLPDAFVAALPPSLRTLARLIDRGMDRTEIAYLLAVSDTALRQRVHALRQAVAAAGERLDGALAIAAGAPDGLKRRALKVALGHHSGRRIAVADPDGHNILLTLAHVSPGRGNMVGNRNRSLP